MASFGKMTNALASVVNENMLALANLNFDFSLVRMQAPEEYLAVGSTLARSRRENAESGSTHRTARKLGALFDAVVPQVPKVIAAYGKRAGHIMETPEVNPPGNTKRHGPFTEFVGADATSIWAAATSGRASIAVRLLACLLARAFKDTTHTASLWAELVQERQREIKNESQSEMFSMAQIAAMNAADQPISRDELRQWDTSARAGCRVPTRLCERITSS